MSAVRVRQITPFGNMHVKITVDPERDAEQEVFAQLGRGGDLATSDLEAICRLASLWLRSGGPLEQVVSQLKGIGSSLQIATKEGRITSLADGLAVSLERYMEAKKLYGLERLLLGKFDASTTKLHRRENGRLRGGFKVRCPECKHGVLRFSEGCVVCRECGFSQC